MALYATNRFPGDGSTTSYEFNFVGKYIARTHVKVYQEDNATKVRTSVPINDSNFLNDTTLRSLPVTPVGKTLVIYRDTPKPPLVDFVNGSRFTEYNMDLVARQGLFVAMEASDAGCSDARQQLLAAIAVVVGLVDDAKAAISDATAAAARAATRAANAATSESQAQAAKVAAEVAKVDAQTAKTDAQTAASAASTSASNAAGSATTASNMAGVASGYATTSGTNATNAATSATDAGKSATAAANSASAASTSAGNAAGSATLAGNMAGVAGFHAAKADTHATNAATSATNAANSATAAASSAGAAASITGSAGPMNCRVVVVDAAARTVRLERCGGKAITIDGQLRTIPVGGITVTMTAGPTPRYLYVSWNGAQVVMGDSTLVPEFDATVGQWILPGLPNYVAVAYARPDALDKPDRFLRNYYNGHGIVAATQQGPATYTANWDGLERQLIYITALVLPGDTIDICGTANIMSDPNDRVGDLIVYMDSVILGRARNTHSGSMFAWQSYVARGNLLQRRPTTDDPAAQVSISLAYKPISNNGGTWVASNDGVSTRLFLTITPYKWA